MRRVPVALALLLLLLLPPAPVTGGAQLETPVPASPVAPPMGSPAASPAAGPVADLAGVAPLPLSGERRAAFEAYVAGAMHRLGVPGASVAVVQGGEVVYAQGVGVKELGGGEPVTADTLLMIGSVTKSMTAALAATAVDDGLAAWETPLVDLLPGFAVADPALTPRLTLADAFCACTGVPRRDPEVLFNVHALTPERLVAQIAGLPLTTPFGETFQYSNQMFAVGGYAAAAAAGAAPGDLLGGYEAAMRERLLNPMGMARSTFALADVLADGDHATGHGAGLDGRTRPFPTLVDEGFVTAVAPAGALWSSAREMARYLQTQLADGVAPDGTRVVSAEHLARTRAPRVAIPALPDLPPLLSESGQHYAMGWLVGAYKGQPLLNHSGGTFGFASDATFLPEADLGVVVLSNDVGAGGAFTLAVRYRLLELLFDRPAEFDPLLTEFLGAREAQLAHLATQLGTVDQAAVAPYLGRYAHPALGEVELALRGGELVFDAGEVHSELRPLAGEAGETAYVFADPPLAGRPVPVTLRPGGDGRPEVAVTVEGENPEATETYVLTRLGSAADATPTP